MTATRRTSHQATYLVLVAGITAFSLLQSLVIPVLPTIEEHLGTDQNTVTWVLTAYLLSASIFTPILGRLGDMRGKERMYVVALLGLAVGSLLAAVADSVLVMIVARVIQGIGGGVLPLSFGIIRDEFPRAKVGGAVGALAALSAGGAGLGIVLAGPIVDGLGYRWLFWVPMIASAIAAFAAFRLIPASPIRQPGRLRAAAPILLAAWLVALLLGISRAPEWGWLSGRVLGLIALAVVLVVVWIRVEVNSPAPLIDMRMMRVTAVWTANLVALLVGVGMYAIFAFMPQFLQTDPAEGYGFGSSIAESGLILLPFTTFITVLGFAAGPLARRVGSKYVLASGCAISTCAFLMASLAHDEKWQVIVTMTLMGSGFGLAFASMASVIVAAVPAAQTGVASGMNANIRTIGGAIGAAVMASIVTSALAPDGVPRESGYTTGFAVLAGVSVVATLAALLIPRAPRDPVTHAEKAPELPHGELAIVPAGTLSGADPE